MLAGSAGDPELFGVFYRRHNRELLRFFWTRTRDREAAEDLAAETFARLFDQVDRFDPQKGSSRSLLYGIAYNLLKKFFRSNKASSSARDRLGIVAAAPPDTWPFEQADARLDQERVLEALERVMPTKNREAVRLRLIGELSYYEIAKTLGCKEGAARVRVLRGIKRLQYEFDTPPLVEVAP